MWCDNVKVKRCVVIEGMFGSQKKKGKISSLYFTIRAMSESEEEDEKSFIGVDLA